MRPATTLSDVIATIVGGNRYGWFTNIDIPGGIAVDNVSLTPLGPVGAVNEDDLATGNDRTPRPIRRDHG
ncbi:MAG: hypothetical protein M5U07_12460 [Xanthobacteraceae bacterium]|nr:hypothetical protein [Xanthobacteraceae bacterium]